MEPYGQERRFSARRRLLRLGAYTPPAVLGALVVAQNDAWASGSKDKNGSKNSSSGSGGNPSCAPCFCAPCGRSGEKNRKSCDDRRKKCNSSSGNKNSSHS